MLEKRGGVLSPLFGVASSESHVLYATLRCAQCPWRDASACERQPFPRPGHPDEFPVLVLIVSSFSSCYIAGAGAGSVAVEATAEPETGADTDAAAETGALRGTVTGRAATLGASETRLVKRRDLKYSIFRARTGAMPPRSSSRSPLGICISSCGIMSARR